VSLSVRLDSLMFIYIHRLSNFTLPQIKVKEQLVVRNDMDVNEHERLSNLTLKTQIKVGWIVSHVHLHPYLFLLQAVPLL
jgi:uncharacterized membrane protein